MPDTAYAAGDYVIAGTIKQVSRQAQDCGLNAVWQMGNLK